MDSLRLTDEERELAIGAIRAYFERERDEEIGELAAGLLLDFVGEQLGPYFFNRGIEDAQARVVRFADSLDADLEAAKRFPEPRR